MEEEERERVNKTKQGKNNLGERERSFWEKRPRGERYMNAMAQWLHHQSSLT